MKRGSSFSVILVAVAASLVGLICLRDLQVQYAPSPLKRSMSVSFYWEGASPAAVEAKVTSVLEGVLSGARSCSGVSSRSAQGYGSVSLDFGKHTDMEAARFEVASILRNIYPKLPEGVSYPSISLGTGGRARSSAMTWVVKGSMPSLEIDKYLRDNVLGKISSVAGVDGVSLYGATPFQWTITYDSDAAAVLGISYHDIASAFASWKSVSSPGMAQTPGGYMPVKVLATDSDDLGAIPVKNVGGRIVHLGDIATFSWHEAVPGSYYRLNGLNTITMNVSIGSDANLLKTASALRSRMSELSASFPDGISASLSYDSSEYMQKELGKVYFRTGLCILLLLLFVLIINRSWRYMLMIAVTLAVNLLLAVVVYYIAGISIHIYTLAGLTVSLGIIIDTSIVMIDHYSYYHDRSVFLSIVGAVATTVVSLLVVLLLPDGDKANLVDFIWIIIINLAVALAVSYFFVPALLDSFPARWKERLRPVKSRRRIVRFSGRYEKYIEWGLKHRWLYVLALVAMFGIPLCFLPEKIVHEEGTPLKRSEEIYNKVVGWKPYADNKNTVDKILGSSIALFGKALSRSDFFREPSRRVLLIRAGMPEGCNVGQLNTVMRSMENYLAQFDEIETFTTEIRSYDNGEIRVEFLPEYEHTSFPDVLKAQVTRMAANFGGANWVVSGVNDSYFNNYVNTNMKNQRISLSGYNFEDLLSYAGILRDRLSANKRIQGAEIWGGDGYEAPGYEFNVDYDFGSMAVLGISPYRYYEELSSILYDSGIGSIMTDGTLSDVVLRSSKADEFDLWNVENTGVAVDSSLVKLSEVGSVGKERSAMEIYRENQAYVLNVCFNFIGSYELMSRVLKEQVTAMNSEVLPIGYRAYIPSYSFRTPDKGRYALLILLVIAVIFAVCSIIFNSIRKPFAIIGIIPISFVGIFLAFGLSHFTFDQGGFASFVMVAGLVVNAGIYIIVAMNRNSYIKAFNHKIIPITLTVISTILGLIPFLFDGPTEVFWFAFAIGTIAGMVMSLVALFFWFPIFLLSRPRR